ncbi:MAG: type II secretion system protein [Candidatus Moraniibacteriota bacterium]
MKNNLNQKNKSKGFTLVELLLVIAIIGILASVLFVSLGKQRERARLTTFKENMRGLVTTFTACCDGGGSIPDGEVLNESAAPACNGGASGIGDLPPVPQCDGDGYVTLNASDDSGDQWGFSAECTTTNTANNCMAYCTPDGCQFCEAGKLMWVDGYKWEGDCNAQACQ